MEIQYITTRDGKKLYAQIYDNGHKNYLIILHGGPGAGCYDFQYIAAKLSKYVNVITFDQRGVLRSDRIEDNDKFSMSYLIDDIEDIRTSLHISTWSVFGHSFGGMLAAIYAAQYPEIVESVIFDCPSFNFNMSMKSVFYKCAEELKALNQLSYADKLECFIDHNINLKDIINELSKIPEEIRNKVYRYSKYTEEVGAINTIPEATDYQWENGMIHFERLLDEGAIGNDFLPLLSKIKCKTLLLIGKYDPVCSTNQKAYYLNNTANSEMVIFDNSGHFPHNDEPHKFIESIIKFLK